MNSNVKKKWLAALRSETYKQGTGALATSSGAPDKSDFFCCLGVLCDLAVKAGVIKEPTLVDDNEEGELYYYGKTHDVLPVSVRTWAGLDDADPEVRYNNQTTNLSELNDDYNLSFKVIANIIEKKL